MPPLVSSHFPSQFFRTLQQFRESRYLCDVRLIADGEIEFPAHRYGVTFRDASKDCGLGLMSLRSLFQIGTRHQQPVLLGSVSIKERRSGCHDGSSEKLQRRLRPNIVTVPIQRRTPAQRMRSWKSPISSPSLSDRGSGTDVGQLRHGTVTAGSFYSDKASSRNVAETFSNQRRAIRRQYDYWTAHWSRSQAQG